MSSNVVGLVVLNSFASSHAPPPPPPRFTNHPPFHRVFRLQCTMLCLHGRVACPWQVVGAVVGRRLTRTGALSVPKGSGPMPPLRTAAPLVGFGGGRPPAAYAKRPSWVWPQGPAAGYGFAKGVAGPRQAAAVANGGSAAIAPALGPAPCGAAQAPWNPLASTQLQSPRRAAAAASRQALQAHLGVHGVGSPCDPSALAAIAPWLLDPLEVEAGALDCV